MKRQKNRRYNANFFKCSSSDKQSTKFKPSNFSAVPRSHSPGVRLRRFLDVVFPFVCSRDFPGSLALAKLKPRLEQDRGGADTRYDHGIRYGVLLLGLEEVQAKVNVDDRQRDDGPPQPLV